MKTKATMIVILLFSFLFMGSAFGKTESLSDLNKLKKPAYQTVFMKNVIDADSISRIFDARPANDYEQFRKKLAPSSGTALTRRYKSKPVKIKKNSNNSTRPRLSDFNIFGSSDKKEL